MSSTHNKGFTLIEVLVVLTLLSFLTSILILYSRGGEGQILLFREQSKLISDILRAKSLAIQTFQTQEKVCGYGVHFEMAPYNNYVIFRELKGADPDNPCGANNRRYDAGEEFEPVTNLEDYGMKLDQSTIGDVFFQPPDPKIYFDSLLAVGEARIILISADGASSATIIIGSGGQVSTQ